MSTTALKRGLTIIADTSAVDLVTGLKLNVGDELVFKSSDDEAFDAGVPKAADLANFLTEEAIIFVGSKGILATREGNASGRALACYSVWEKEIEGFDVPEVGFKLDTKYTITLIEPDTCLDLEVTDEEGHSVRIPSGFLGIKASTVNGETARDRFERTNAKVNNQVH